MSEAAERDYWRDPPRTETINFRVTLGERKRFAAAARKAKLSLSDYVRESVERRIKLERRSP